MFGFILFGILCSIYGTLFVYYRYGWFKAEEALLSNHLLPLTKFSIIICARNEEQSISACLSSILKQNYPKDLYEVIVINDHSSDKTAAIVKSFQSIKLINLSDYVKHEINSYKKYGISIGVGVSNGEYIVTTDADCEVPVNWLRSFDNVIQRKKLVFITGPVSIKTQSGFLNKFESIDFMMLQGITVAAVATGLHPMSNGANLCYKKTVFEEVEGYQQIDEIASGDDLLLMQKIKEIYPDKIQYLKSKDAIVTTSGALTIKAFIRQRVRWASKGKFYKGWGFRFILLFVYFLNLLLLSVFVMGVFNATYLEIFLISITIKSSVELLVLYPAAIFFKKTRLLWYYIIFQPVHIFYMVVAGFFGNTSKYEWKARQVR
jgi:cellulose synthase/poly-beta-1,6-N-acetylglucosamine synthase-like glycosyltransferase